MIAALATSLLVSPSFAMTGGRCLPLDPTNPAYQVLCARFDENANGCETQRHICYWKSQAPTNQPGGGMPIEWSASQDASLIANQPISF